VLWLFGRLQFGFQGLQVAHSHASAIDPNHSLRLQPGKIAGYELAHRANLRSQFLVADGHGNFDAVGGGFAFLLGKTKKKGSQTVAHCGKRKLFDNSDQTAQARPHHAQHLQRNLGMRETQCLKILFAHKQETGLADRGYRSGVGSSIEDRQLSDGTAWAINAQYLLATAGGALENPHLAGLDNVKSGTRLSFPKHTLARRVVARDRALGQEPQLVLRQP